MKTAPAPSPDPDNYVDDYEFPDLYGSYRAHLNVCPLIHTGLLANCVEGVRLAAAWLDEDWPGYGAAGTTPRFSWRSQLVPDLPHSLLLAIVPALSTLRAEQRSGAVCVWCPRSLPPGEGIDLSPDGRLRTCPPCHTIQTRVLVTYLDWYDHGITCLYCPLGPCERGEVLGAQHLAARERAGKPELSCVGCRTPIAPGEAIRPHLWQGMSGPVHGYLHARRCPTSPAPYGVVGATHAP